VRILSLYFYVIDYSTVSITIIILIIL